MDSRYSVQGSETARKTLCFRLPSGPADNAAMVIGWLPIVGPIESGVGFRLLLVPSSWCDDIIY